MTMEASSAVCCKPMKLSVEGPRRLSEQRERELCGGKDPRSAQVHKGLHSDFFITVHKTGTEGNRLASARRIILSKSRAFKCTLQFPEFQPQERRKWGQAAVQDSE